MRASLEEILQKEKIMVIDGSMSTALEVLGANLSNTLWTASVLRDQPELVRQVRQRVNESFGVELEMEVKILG